MNYLDLFSGIGGFHKGLEEAGFKFDWTGHSEIDKYAKSIYQGHFKESEDLGDVTNINVQDLPRSKKWIVTGGWPCQDNSIAGKRKGQRGSTRSGLLSQIIRLIGELIDMGAEVIFIGENVKGLFSVNDGVDFLDSIRGLTYLDKDSPQLTLEMQLLNTRWFLPQNRERVYFVGYPRGSGKREIFPIGEGGQFVNNKQGDNAESQIASCLQSPGNACGNYKGMNAVKVGTWRTHKDGEGFREMSDNVSPTIPARAREDGSGQPVVKIEKVGNIYPKGGENGDVFDTKGICRTLKSGETSNKKHGGIGSSNSPKILQQSCIRRLTPTECERLQGFPDGWTEGVSDTQRYKTLGNAVSVPVVKAVGERIKIL